MNKTTGGFHQMGKKIELILRESKRQYFQFIGSQTAFSDNQWSTEILREFLICVHAEKDISDIYIVSGEEVSVKCSYGNLPVTLVEKYNLCVTSSKLLKDFFNSINIDFFSVLKSGGRLTMRVLVPKPREKTNCSFRMEVNSYSNGPESTSAVAVLRPTSIPPKLSELNVHELIKTINEIYSGMVLFLGSTGTGKSTSSFSLLRERSRTISQTILTIEDPIEYDITSPKDKISRVIQYDIKDFGNAGMKGAMKTVVRQNPDTVLVGEMRDLESVELAIAVALSEHQVFSTLHVDRPWNVPNRIFEIINSEGKGRATLMTDFLIYIHVMVAQKLIPKKGGGKIAVSDVLILTSQDKLLIIKTHGALSSGNASFSHEGHEFYSVSDAIKYITYLNEKKGRGVTMETMLKKAYEEGVIEEMIYLSEIEKLNNNVLE